MKLYKLPSEDCNLIDYKNKRVLIFGLGLNEGGVGAAKFFTSLGANVKVTDLKDKETLKPSLESLKDFKNISYTLGEHKFEDITWADIVIRNPATLDNNPYLKFALENEKQVETDFSIFLKFANQRKMIAVTGTKGKSTTASLIYEVIKASGKKVILAGNIGKSILSAIDYLNEDPWIVAEISSFQLQALKEKDFAPKIAVITNIYPDHLNWHTSMEEYIQAKRIIAANQSDSDYLVISCQEGLNSKLTQGIKSKIVQSCGEDFTEDFLKYYPSTDGLPLKGTANMENYAASQAVCLILGISDGEIFKAFLGFKGAEFRMQLIGEFDGVKIINDSTSTNPVSTTSALEAIGNQTTILIAGGMNKGLDYHKLSSGIETSKNIKSLFLLEGDASQEIVKYISNPEIVKGKSFYNNLDSLLQDVKKEAKKGDAILFSPGATSFNLFQNEFDRGRQFNKAVEKVFGKDIIL